jgi:hypothetical protein
MLPGYRFRTNIGISIGLILQFTGAVLSASEWAPVGPILELAGVFILIYGCAQYSKGKGHSKWLGVLGLFSTLGVLILMILSDKHKDVTGGATQVRAGETSGPENRCRLAPSIGPYHLESKATDFSGLVELTQAEKEALVIGVEFRDEHIFKAPPAEFAGIEWEIVVGAMENSIYKISALFSIGNRGQRDNMWRYLDDLLRKLLGTPATEAQTIIIWDAEDGNVVMNQTDFSGEFFIVLTLTSLSVRNFVLAK